MTAAGQTADLNVANMRGWTMTAPVLVAFALLLLAAVGGWSWVAYGYATADRTRQSLEVRGDLSEAHTSLLGARVDLYERDYIAASRKLELARELLRRAGEPSVERHSGAVVTQGDLARFELDLDEAQRLLVRLDQDASASAPDGVIDDTPEGGPLPRR